MSIMKIWDAMCGRNPLAEKESFERTAASLQNYLSAFDTYKAVCVGTMNKAKLETSVNKLVEVLKSRGVDIDTTEGHKYTLVIGGNVLTEASCIEKLEGNNGVIIFEEAYASTFSKIDEEMNALKELHVEVVGTVMVHH